SVYCVPSTVTVMRIDPPSASRSAVIQITDTLLHIARRKDPNRRNRLWARVDRKRDRHETRRLVEAEGAKEHLVHYTTSKRALVGMARAFAAELGQHDIRVDSIHPGAVNTPMGSGSMRDRIAQTAESNPGSAA
ncbi:SDR family oxidoreductase, partial [Rhodococcus pyridinivorans]|uniref:SDR family oxidoreductase n=2 Tax=Nocardiaceae TaxID=85025 RepID=UPI0024B96318